MTTAELRRGLAEAVNEVAYGGGRKLITRHGKPIAALVSVEDLEAMEALEDLMDMKAALEAKREAEAEGGTLDAATFFASLDAD